MFNSGWATTVAHSVDGRRVGRVQVLLDKMLKHFKANGHKVRFLAAARRTGDEALGSRDPKCARWRSEV
jgi:hypothetical protein